MDLMVATVGDGVGTPFENVGTRVGIAVGFLVNIVGV